MYEQHSTVTMGNFENDKQCLGPCCGFGTVHAVVGNSDLLSAQVKISYIAVQE